MFGRALARATTRTLARATTRTPGRATLRALALAGVAVLSACSQAASLVPKSGDAEIACSRGCPVGQKCHVSADACVFGGIATCAACASGFTCSPAFPAPTCVQGACAPRDAFTDGTAKLVSLAIAPRDRGCDLDGDGKPNNRIATLLTQIDLNGELARAVEADRITVLLEPDRAGWGAPGDALGVGLWFGTLAPQSRSCAPSDPAALCTYTVSRASYDPSAGAGACPTWLRFPGVARTVDAVASTSGSALDFVVPVGGGSWLLQLLRARIDAKIRAAEVSGPGLGPRLDGRLCAAVPKADILLAVDTLPPDTLAKFGGADLVRTALDLNLKADLDIDGDGAADSVSAALEWTAVPARIVGYSPDAPAAAPK